MKPLQITLFLIANVIFLTQAGRHVHQFIFGTRPSAMDEFALEQNNARGERSFEALVAEYRLVNGEILAGQKGKNRSESADFRALHQELFEKRDAIRNEINERERRLRELRDLWLFSGFAIALILVGTVLYRRGIAWPGFSILVTGFGILEYWSSPTFFGGASEEFHALLTGKIVLTLASLALLYGFWRMRDQTGDSGEDS
jgi:hypothetical protein